MSAAGNNTVVGIAHPKHLVEKKLQAQLKSSLLTFSGSGKN